MTQRLIPLVLAAALSAVLAACGENTSAVVAPQEGSPTLHVRADGMVKALGIT